jgi:hypothetical protein
MARASGGENMSSADIGRFAVEGPSLLRSCLVLIFGGFRSV